MLEFRASRQCADTRFTYYQVPVRVEDDLSRSFPSPSDYSISTLNIEIRERFIEGPGKLRVLSGDYEVYNAKNTKQLFTVATGNVLLPAMTVHMAIILDEPSKGGQMDKAPLLFAKLC